MADDASALRRPAVNPGKSIGLETVASGEYWLS